MEKMHHLVKIPEIFASVSGKVDLYVEDADSLHTSAIIKNRGTLTAYNCHSQWQLEWTLTNGEKKNFDGKCKITRARIEMLRATKQ
uniref:AlNc14C34G3092 protein n=1 Tax=Albugo laibachii Nc14 TaxID=890382 RepID=F0W8G2_9STRA|nr:AlNc14C34G3092 [Albugo laibachii Nc14]|eukprot:CCA17417.1 AlNc14C34G3092 [Albugo laibachii Nc14]